MLPIDIASQTMGLDVIGFRLFCSLIIGVIIGTERQNAHRPAGMRTHMLVALGSCAVTITSQLLFAQYHALGANADPARLSAQVIAGVGFLGAGTIIREGASVKGLTTAASIWTVACLGIAVGAGYYFVGLLGTTGMLMTLIVFEWVQKKFMWDRYGHHTYEVCCSNIELGLSDIHAAATSRQIQVRALQAEQTEDGVYLVSFHATCHGRNATKRLRGFFSEIIGKPEVFSVKSDIHYL